MKECAWCGDDFRGEGFTLDDQYFCSENCREEYRKDVFGEEEPEESKQEESGAEG